MDKILDILKEKIDKASPEELQDALDYLENLTKMAKDTLKSDFQQFLDKMCVKYDRPIEAQDIADLWNEYAKCNPDIWKERLEVIG